MLITTNINPQTSTWSKTVKTPSIIYQTVGKPSILENKANVSKVQTVYPTELTTELFVAHYNRITFPKY